jgi:hypothetical protein
MPYWAAATPPWADVVSSRGRCCLVAVEEDVASQNIRFYSLI